jgi:type II secretory pathway pseudopilin PulG
LLSWVFSRPYGETVERSRESEAKAFLGQIRTAVLNYKIDHGYSADGPNWVNIGMTNDYETCKSRDRYFKYSFDNETVTATRCTSGTGKPPSGSKAYKIHIYMINGTIYKDR